MRAGFIIYGDLSIISGGYLYDRQLVNFLRAQGDEIEIFSLPWRNYGRHLFDNLRFSFARRLQQSSFDILLQDELNHPSLFLLNRRIRSHKIPLVSIVHHLRSSEQHPGWQLKLFRQVEHSYLRNVDGFIFNSKTTRAAVWELSGQKKPHVIAYPSGSHHSNNLSPAAIAARAHRKGPLQILSIGNISPRKGLLLTLDALRDLPPNSWHWDIVGDLTIDSGYANRLMKTADSYGLSTNITWHGRLPNIALAERMVNNHVLVMPSSYEGFGIAYLEGMGFGLPAIGTTSGAAQEIIADGENGFIIAPDDAGTLAEHLLALYKDRQLLAQMGIAALKKSSDHPTWEESMKNVREFLLQLINRMSRV